MPKWTDYTIKTNPADKDEMMILDTSGKANKRLGLSALSDWILNKLADKIFQKLETNNKTVLGALNELNSNSFRVIISSFSPTIESIIDSQIADRIMLIYGTAGAGTKQGLPANGCVWLGIAVAATEHTFSSLYLFGNNHVYAKAKTEGKWGNYVTVA